MYDRGTNDDIEDMVYYGQRKLGLYERITLPGKAGFGDVRVTTVINTGE